MHGLTPLQRSLAAIAAATAMNLPFGTIYAFSVFLKPMEALMGIGRAEMTLIFGLAACTLTVGMNLAPMLYRTLPPATLIAVAGAGSAAGLYLTANATGFAELALGYGVLFGLGGGIGFIGLVVPHLLRPLVGHSPSRLLLASALGGAALLLAADILVRVLPTGMELKLGVVTALVGAPFFLWLIFRARTEIES